MDFLSESQLQLISEFRERVRQSEKRLTTTFEQTENNLGLRTPEMLPFITTHDEFSKVSDLPQTKEEDTQEQIMIQDMGQDDLQSPPQKQLHPTIFNGTPGDQSPTIPQSHEKDHPRSERITASAQKSPLGSASKQNSAKTTNLSVANYHPKEIITRSQYLQSFSPTLERQGLDEAYRRQMGYQEVTRSLIPRVMSISMEDDGYTHGAMGSNNSEQVYREGEYFGSQLDQYLKSQEKPKVRDQETRASNTEYEYIYHLSDEHRRLKVPSIRMFEDYQSSNVVSTKSREDSRKYSDMHDDRVHSKISSNVVSTKSREDSRKYSDDRLHSKGFRNALITKEDNRGNEQDNANQDQSSEDRDSFKRYMLAPVLNEEIKKRRKEYSKTDKGQLSDLRKVPSYPKKGENDKSIKNLNSKEVKYGDSKPKQKREAMSPRNKENLSKKDSTNESINRMPSPSKSQERVRMRSLSRDTKATKKLREKSSGKINKTKMKSPKKDKEMTRKDVAQDVIRKIQLGTIDQSQLINILEEHMHVSEELYEDLTNLVKRHR